MKLKAVFLLGFGSQISKTIYKSALLGAKLKNNITGGYFSYQVICRVFS